MTVTLTTSYDQFLEPDTVLKLKSLTEEDSFDLNSALEYIDEHGENDFKRYYEEYVELGEQYGYEAVDAFIGENDVSDLKYFVDAYIGEYESPERMAEDYFEGETDRLDYRISIDWLETSAYLLQHEVDQVGDFYFRSSW